MTLDELATALGTSAGHLHKWETDKVAIPIARLNDIASVLEIGLHDLIRDPSRVNSVPVTGVLDHFGNVESVEDFATGKPRVFVDAPDGIDVDTGAAIEVAGDALHPVPNGWLLFYNRIYDGIQTGSVNNLSVVKVKDSPSPVVRRLGEGRGPPLFNLFSPHVTEMLDVHVDWACPVVCIRPNPKAESIS